MVNDGVQIVEDGELRLNDGVPVLEDGELIVEDEELIVNDGVETDGERTALVLWFIAKHNDSKPRDRHPSLKFHIMIKITRQSKQSFQDPSLKKLKPEKSCSFEI